MKKVVVIFVVMAVLAVSLPARAEIIDWNCADDGDGKIVMGAPTWGENPDYSYTLGMSCNQYGVPGDAGHIGGDFTTDTELDPTVWIVESVDNYTNFAWTDYHITIGMNKTFTIGAVVTPLDWTYVVTAPAPGTIPNGGGPGWVGTVDYFVGTGSPIAITGSGDFGLKVSFLGSVAFNTEQIPTPEPTTLALLSVGALALIRRKRA